MITTEKIERQFKLGACVQLPSGGYPMTITGFMTKPNMGTQPVFNGYVECSWFENNSLVPENLHKTVFPQDALVACSPNS